VRKPSSVWFPHRGETEADGVERVAKRGSNAFDSVREMVEAIAERDWARSDYWDEETVRARWMGVAYEFRVTVRSEPSFEYEGKELSE